MTLALLLPWAVIAFQGWLIYLLLRQHGRALLGQEELRERLAGAERTLQLVFNDLGDIRQGAAADPHAGHDHGAHQSPEGLPLGSPAPSFALPDLDGRERTLQEFLGQPLLLVFYSPQCGFCVQMAPSLGQLPEDGHRVLLVSQGDAEEHRRLAAEHGWRCDVLLQHGWEISNTYQANGTPTGYLLDAQGQIGSSLAIGADALLQLVSAAPDTNGRVNGSGLTAESLRDKEQAAAARARGAGLAVTTSRLNRQGLPAGTPAPDFRLPDLSGAEHALSEFRGTRVLLVFSDPECGPCQAVAPKLARLHQERRPDGLQVVMVSRGDLQANRAKAKEHGFTFPVLVQKHWEISRQYAMFATPVAYLLDEQGVITEDVAIGPDAILTLAGAEQGQARPTGV